MIESHIDNLRNPGLLRKDSLLNESRTTSVELSPSSLPVFSQLLICDQKFERNLNLRANFYGLSRALIYAQSESGQSGQNPRRLHEFPIHIHRSNELNAILLSNWKACALAMKVPLFELCVTDLEAARAAEGGGADRIELCSRLSIGGVTPDFDLMMKTIEALSIPVYVLVRPRAGDFVFSSAEFEEMKGQIAQAKAAGAAGVAIGILLRDGRVDVKRTSELAKLARPMKVTFHRAFDETPDLAEALNDVLRCGVDCLLTSGGKPDVLTGAESIANLRRLAAGRLDVMAGGGLRLASLVEVLRRTGVFLLHGSLSSTSGEHTEEASNGKLRSSRSGPVVSKADVHEAVRLLHREFAAREFQTQPAP
jgi:copper homeostasis protein